MLFPLSETLFHTPLLPPGILILFLGSLHQPAPGSVSFPGQIGADRSHRLVFANEQPASLLPSVTSASFHLPSPRLAHRKEGGGGRQDPCASPRGPALPPPSSGVLPSLVAGRGGAGGPCGAVRGPCPCPPRSNLLSLAGHTHSACRRTGFPAAGTAGEISLNYFFIAELLCERVCYYPCLAGES